jgi:hypothetical protein
MYTKTADNGPFINKNRSIEFIRARGMEVDEVVPTTTIQFAV